MTDQVPYADIVNKETDGENAALLVNDTKRAINELITEVGPLKTAANYDVGTDPNQIELNSQKTFKSFDSLTSAIAFVTANPDTIERLSTASYRDKAECATLGIDYPDGGGADYVVEALATPDGYGDHAAGAKQLTLNEQSATPAQFGVVDNTSVDSTQNYRSHLTYTNLRRNILTTSSITKNGGDLMIDSANVILPSSGTSLSVSNTDRSRISNSSFTRVGGDALSTGHLAVFPNQSNILIEDSEFQGITGVGTALIAYSSDEDVTIDDITYNNVKVSGDVSLSDNTNGALIADSNRGIMTNIRATGIHDFAVEYKNKTRDSLISNIIVQDSKQGIGFGQTTVGTDDTSYCATSNATLHGCDVGIVLGDADYNVFSNIAINSEGAPSVDGAAKTGIRATGASIGNTFTGISISGSNMQEPVRWGGASENNFASVALHNGAATQVVLENGSRRNVTEVMHSGNLSSILNTTNDVSGNPRSGINGNPVYCHALGQYDGILSANWHFKYSDAGAVAPSAIHTLVVESAGDNFIGLLSDGSSSSGLSVRTPAGEHQVSLSSLGDYWKFGTPTHALRMYNTTLRPESSSVMSLGSTSNRFKDVHADSLKLKSPDGTIFTVTVSDAGALVVT